MNIKSLKGERLGQEKLNYQGCPMKIVEYYNANHIVVQFNDKHSAKVQTAYKCFKTGRVKNPYYPSVLGKGYIGTLYPTSVHRNYDYMLPEYIVWNSMLTRCYSDLYKGERSTYNDVVSCEEWLNYENFYEWIHSQENFDQWLNSEDKWCVDKDIILKGNRMYSPDACCLVPEYINVIFIKSNRARGKYPIGVSFEKKSQKFTVHCNSGEGKQVFLGYYSDPEEAFQAYKIYKEQTIKETAQEAYSKGEITKRCYEAMMNYEVEITD